MKLCLQTIVFVLTCVATHIVVQAIRSSLVLAQSQVLRSETLELTTGDYDYANDPDYMNSTPAQTSMTSKRLVGRKPILSFASVSIPTFDVVLAGQEALISATASLTSNNPSTRYVWRLRSYSNDNSVFSNKVYVEQNFFVNESGKMNPTFSDSITVPLGFGHVVLSLFALPIDLDIGIVDDDVKSDVYVAARRSYNLSTGMF